MILSSASKSREIPVLYSDTVNPKSTFFLLIYHIFRWAHEGTLEYTSRDAHIGSASRRGDIEVRGANNTLPPSSPFPVPQKQCSGSILIESLSGQ